MDIIDVSLRVPGMPRIMDRYRLLFEFVKEPSLLKSGLEITCLRYSLKRYMVTGIQRYLPKALNKRQFRG